MERCGVAGQPKLFVTISWSNQPSLPTMSATQRRRQIATGSGTSHASTLYEQLGRSSAQTFARMLAERSRGDHEATDQNWRVEREINRVDAMQDVCSKTGCTTSTAFGVVNGCRCIVRRQCERVPIAYVISFCHLTLRAC